MTANEKFLTQRQRYQPAAFPQDFSDEEMARDWTLSEADKKEVNRWRQHYNHVRPHSSLNYLPPVAFARQAA